MLTIYNMLFKQIKSSLRNQIIVIFIGVIIIPLLTSIYISYTRFANEQMKSYIYNNTELLSQVNIRLDDYFKGLNNILVSMYEQKGIFNSPENPNSNQGIDEGVSAFFSTILSQYKEISSALLYYPSSKGLYVKKQASYWQSYYKNVIDLENMEWYKMLVDNDKDFRIEPTHVIKGYKPEYGLNGSEPVFTISRYYNLQLHGKIVGVASINVNTSNIQKICDNLIRDKIEQISLTDKTGGTFYNSMGISGKDLNLNKLINVAKANKGSFEYTQGKDKWLVVYSKSDYMGNILYKLMPLDAVYMQASTTLNISLVIFVITTLAMVAASIGISYGIIRPISRLEKNMAKVSEGNFESFVPITRIDEVGKISNAFNTMVKKINILITEKYKIQLICKHAQLKALEAQINPHFLNNTLQAIGSTALEAECPDIYKMTKALSDMLRYSIKFGGNVVTIKDELKNIQDYLFIQKFRFQDKLDYSIDIPSELLSLKIPKLIFQPIVENAIIHGIEPKKSKGTVSITCRKDNEYLNITVVDDGIGMTDDELSRIQSELNELESEKDNNKESIGISNVYTRLKLVMGEECHMLVISEKSMGTKVSIRILLK